MIVGGGYTPAGATVRTSEYVVTTYEEVPNSDPPLIRQVNTWYVDVEFDYDHHNATVPSSICTVG